MKLIMLCFGLCLSFAAMGQADENIKEYQKLMSSKINKPYLPFQMSTLDGRVLNNSNIKGKVTFLNFWMIGCPPCRAEDGELKKVYNRFSKDTSFQFVGVTFDERKILPDFLTGHGINYPIACVSAKVASNMMYSMDYPSTIIIDKQGNVACLVMGKIEDVTDHTYKDMMNHNFSVRTDTVMNTIDRLLHGR